MKIKYLISIIIILTTSGCIDRVEYYTYEKNPSWNLTLHSDFMDIHTTYSRYSGDPPMMISGDYRESGGVIDMWDGLGQTYTVKRTGKNLTDLDGDKWVS